MMYGNYTDKMASVKSYLLECFIEGCLNAKGIKSPITKSKLKWHGIKLIVINNIGSYSYRLEQRGVPISETFKV